MFQLNWFVFARLEIISSALSKLPQTTARNLKLRLQRTLPKLWAACGPDVTEIFIIPIQECSLETYTHFFFLYTWNRNSSTESWSATKAPNEIPKQFFYLKRCLVSHIVMEDENTLFACILELFKILRYCYLQRRSWSSALCFRPLNCASPKELMRTKFWNSCPIILRSGILSII